MLLHTCAPPTGGSPKARAIWVCPECGSVWEAAPEDGGIFDFDRNDVVTRAEWLRVDTGALLAG